MNNSQAKLFILFDGRTKIMDTDDAAVMDTAYSAEEAQRDSETTWKRHDAVWYEYDIVDNELANERMRADIGKGFLL